MGERAGESEGVDKADPMEIETAGPRRGKKRKRSKHQKTPKKVVPGGRSSQVITGPFTRVAPTSSPPRVPRPKLTPYWSNNPLIHARQDGWDCLLHAFRACVRSRVPTRDTFVEDCLKLGFQGVAHRQQIGYNIQMLRKWLSVHMPPIALKKMKKRNFSRVSLNYLLHFT